MHRIPEISAAFALAALAIAACKGAEAPAEPAAAPGDPGPGCAAGAFLETRLVGAIDADIDWHGAGLACEGMPRPDEEGARIRFAGTVDNHRLAIIIAMPALRRGETGAELSSNVTLIEEGAGRFFSTADNETCWTDVTWVEQTGDANGYGIGGTLYCVAPLVEVNGSASVSLSELQFRGLLDWSAS